MQTKQDGRGGPMQTDAGTTNELGVSANVLTTLVFILTTVVRSQHAFLILLCPGRHTRSP